MNPEEPPIPGVSVDAGQASLAYPSQCAWSYVGVSPRAGGKCRCFPGWIGCGLSAQRPLAHVLILGPVPRDLDLVGSHLVVDVVNHQCDHNDEAQDEPQNQRQGFLQLLPFIHWAFML